MSRPKFGKNEDETLDQGEEAGTEAAEVIEPQFDLDTQEVESSSDGIDYDSPVPKGSGGSFYKKNGKRYRKRPA